MSVAFLDRQLGKKKSGRDLGMSELGIVLIVVILAVGGVGAYFLMRPQSDFQVENLSLSQDEITKEDTVTAQVGVSNIGNAEGTHTIELEVGDETFTKDVTLDAEESRTVSFDIEKQEEGTYEVNVSEMTQIFEVIGTYRGDASEYLLTEDEIGGDWTKNKTRGPNFGTLAMESGRVINFDRNGDNLTVAVIVLESIEDAEQQIDDRRSTYKSYGEYKERDLGDESVSISFWGRTFFDVRIANVHVEVYGNIPLTDIREYAEQQVEKIEG